MGEARRRRIAFDDVMRLRSYDKAFDRIVASVFRTRMPPVLYHYTSWEGAKGIMRSRELWLTASENTNDSSELVSVDKTIVECAQTLRSSFVGGPARILDQFVANYDRDKISNKASVFLFCLTVSRDDDYFWKCDYSQRGAGLCLGFRFLREENRDIPGFGGGFLRVDYDEASWRERLLRNFKRVLHVVPSTENHDRPIVSLAVATLNRIAACAAIQGKDAHWANEKELRFVMMKMSNLQPRVSEEEGRRLKLPVRPDGKPPFLDEIIVGPRQPTGNATGRVRDFLRSVGYPSKDAPMPKLSESGSRS